MQVGCLIVAYLACGQASSRTGDHTKKGPSQTGACSQAIAYWSPVTDVISAFHPIV